MGLFTADLFKSFAIGFVLGTAALAGAMSLHSNEGVIAPAQAATSAPLPDQTLAAPVADAAR